MKKLSFQSKKKIKFYFLIISAINLLVISITSINNTKFGVYNSSAPFHTWQTIGLLIFMFLLFYLFLVDTSIKKLCSVTLVILIVELFSNILVRELVYINITTKLIVSTLFIFLSLFKIRENNLLLSFEFNKIYELLILIGFALLIFIYSYYYFDGFKVINGKTPLGDVINTWVLTGWDQGAYYRMVQNIATGKWFFGGFHGGYYYPIGYPIIASLFYYIYPNNPFLIVNAILFCVTLYFSYKLLTKYTDKIIAMIVILLIATQSPLNNFNEYFMKIFIMPWNNLVTVCVAFIYIYTIFIKEELSIKLLFIMGLLYGWVFASRYGDIIFLFPLAFFLVFKSNKFDFKNFLIKGISFAIGSFLIVLPVLFSHKIFYGGYFKTYTQFATDGGSFFPALFDLRVHFFKFFELFLLPSTGVKYRSFIPSSFLLPMIYIIFFPYGTYHLLKTKKAETLIALLFIVMNIIYFTATGAVSSGQIKYHCMRYFTPTILIFAFFSFYGIFTFMNKSEGKILNKIIIPSIIGITILLTTIFFNPKIKRDIKTVFDSGTKVNLVFKSKKIDYVKLKPYPNFGKDGKMDYYFEGKFDSFYPISLWKVHVSYLKDKEIKWESRHSQIKGDKNIVGVGIVNEINKNIDYLSFGDNYRYNNFYLIRDKRIKLFLPVSKELKGKFKFTFFTNRGIFNKIINVR